VSHRASPHGGRDGGPRSTRCRPAIAALLVATAWQLSSPPPLHAHGVPTPLDFWGAFGRRLARCQRVIGRNAAVCGLHAWSTRQTCRLGALHGVPCDQDAADAAIETERIAAVNAVGATCSDQQVATLVFNSKSEAESDVVNFCRDLENAAVSAVFLPVPADPTATPPEVRRCVEATAWATTKLLRAAFESRQLLLDRIALESFSPTEKRTLLGDSTAAIARDTAVLQTLMAGACPPDAFTRTYGRDPATFFDLIATRADCLAGRAYAQGGVLCPASVCGNGMQEAGEDCDDGNLVDGDGCSPTCTRE
jgi:cysteine-rich repeat protein